MFKFLGVLCCGYITTVIDLNYLKKKRSDFLKRNKADLTRLSEY